MLRQWLNERDKSWNEKTLTNEQLSIWFDNLLKEIR